MGKMMLSHFLPIFDWILFIFAGNEDMYKSLNSARCAHWFPWQQIGLQWEKRCHHIFLNVFDRIHFIYAGNDDIHKSLNEFEMQ